MDGRTIYHKPRRIDLMVTRSYEIERDICECPPGEECVRCPDCGCVMMYRGVAQLRAGTRVHVFECVHSHREVHSVSIVVSQ